MIEKAIAILVWALVVAGISFWLGLVYGQETSRRECAEEKVEDLRDQMKRAPAPIEERQLRQMRSVLNDAHKHILAVSKGLEKQPR
jgi:hypothetical protein